MTLHCKRARKARSFTSIGIPAHQKQVTDRHQLHNNRKQQQEDENSKHRTK